MGRNHDEFKDRGRKLVDALEAMPDDEIALCLQGAIHAVKAHEYMRDILQAAHIERLARKSPISQSFLALPPGEITQD